LKVGAGTYKALVLPNLERMEASALSRVAAYCRGGGDRRGDAEAARPGGRGGGRTRPSRVEADWSKEIFGRDPKPGVPHPCGLGRGLFLSEDRDAGPALREWVVPSVRISPRPPTVGFVHRSLENRDLYSS